MDAPRYPLGHTGITLTPIGLGCWQFSGGKGLAGSYWAGIEQARVNEIVQAAIDGGISWFDTAEAYGKGRSEDALSVALQAAGISPESQDVLLATKWMPVLRFAGSIRRTFPDRAEHLSPYPVTLHQIHNPFSFSRIERQIDEMAKLADEGRIQAVGVSNFSADSTERAHEALARRGLTLASNQVKYSLLDRRVEHGGVIERARELGITIIAYSPLEQGILTGKFHRDPQARERISGFRRFLKAFKPQGLEQTEALVRTLEMVAGRHDATAAQVALAWTTQIHGETVVAIPGASSESQATGNAGSMSLRLTPDDLDELDRSSRSVASST